MFDHLKYIDLSLSRIRDFLEKLGNPQNNIKNIIHVAGTNGKGSSCSFLRSILEYHGFTVNLFTSPHLISYNERIRLAKGFITEQEIKEIKNDLSKIEGYYNLSFFELTVAIAFIAFNNNAADFCILETGLGGRLDSTNVINSPKLSIITAIDYDHENFLGNTLTKIAYEKAGIIKKGSEVISDYQHAEVIPVLKRYTSKRNIPITIGGEDYYIMENKLFYNSYEFDLSRLSLKGEYQLNNASLSIIASIKLLSNFEINKISKALSNTQWIGRLQQIDNLYGINFNHQDKVYLDGAHNPLGIRGLVDFINDNYFSDYHISLVLGLLRKKNAEGIFKELSVLKDKNIKLYPIEVCNHDSYSVEELSAIAKKYGLLSLEFNNIQEILSDIKDNSTDKQHKNLVFICGSLYLIGSILSENKKF